MQIININDVYILVEEIQNESPSRRVNERMAVTTLLGEAIPGARLGHQLSGAPYIINHPNLYISVSHSQSHAAIAISRNKLGIDIEAPRKQQLKRVSSRFMSPEELIEFSSLSDGYLRAWTAKEAVFKCAGLEKIDFATEIHISTDGTATLRDKKYSLHWHNLGQNLLCIAQ